MKKMKKVLASILVAATLVFAITMVSGCEVKIFDKDFSVKGLTLTLEKQFAVSESESFDAYFWDKDSDIHIYVIKEYFSPLRTADIPVNSFDDYVKYNCDIYEVDEDGVVEDDGFSYVTVEKALERVESKVKQNFVIIVAMYEGKDAYWTVEFACRKVEFSSQKDTLLRYARSAEFYDYTAPEKTFDDGTFSITLTDEFKKADGYDDYYACFYSGEMSFYVDRYEKSEFDEEVDFNTFVDNCLAVMAGGDAGIATFQGLTYFSTAWESDKGVIIDSEFYMFESEDSFWTVEVLSDYDDYERLDDARLNYALTVKIK